MLSSSSLADAAEDVAGQDLEDMDTVPGLELDTVIRRNEAADEFSSLSIFVVYL